MQGKGKRYRRKLFRYDLRFGIWRQWKWFLGAVPLFCLLYADLTYMTQYLAKESGVLPNLGDYLLYAWGGIPPYDPASGDPFPIPVYWLAQQIYLAFLVGGYVVKDLAGYGQHLLLRSRTRVVWWASKCCWNMFCVLLYYLCGILCAGIFAAWTGGFSLQAVSVVLMRDYQAFAGCDMPALISMMFVLPVIMSLAVSQLQMFLALVTRPVYSYMITSAVMLASAYYTSAFLPGNWGMALRNASVQPGGIYSAESAGLALLLALCSIVAGAVYFSRCDILEKSS
jgi:hypothetical protein